MSGTRPRDVRWQGVNDDDFNDNGSGSPGRILPVFACGRRMMSNVCFQAFNQYIVKASRPLARSPLSCNGYSSPRLLFPPRPPSGLGFANSSSPLLHHGKQSNVTRCITWRTFHSQSSSQAAHHSSRPAKKPSQRTSRSGTRTTLRDLNEAELKAVFGKDVDVKEGNDAIRKLQARRTTGALVEHGVNIEQTSIPEGELRQALQWLRQRYPVDEERAAESWAERASAELEKEYDKRAEELGLIKKRQDDHGPTEADVYSRPGNRSMLDDMRIYNERKAKEREEELERSGEAQRSRDLQIAKSSEAERQAKEREQSGLTR